MKIKKLVIKNFKGLRTYVFEPNGQDCSIFGDNGTFKTTLADSFSWLLFSKDSLNKSDFEIKALDADGEAAHGLEHEVTGVFDQDGRELTLRKRLTERWVKKRGSAKSEFTGHSIDHWVDTVPVKEGEYKARIAEIAAEQTFRLLTNPRFFSEHMKWQDRRKVLLEVCGDITDEDVIASDAKLSRLPEILNDRSLDDHRKVLAGRRVEINKELDLIPARISENQRSITETDADPGKTAEQLAEHTAAKAQLESEIVMLESGGAIAEKTKRLREIESELLDLRNKEREGTEGALSVKRTELGKIRGELETAQREVKSASDRITDNNAKIEGYRANINKLREQWKEADAETFEYEEKCTCPTCGQSLPEEKVQAAREAALAGFNLNKSNRLEGIVKEADMYKTFVARLEAENAKSEEARQVASKKSEDLAGKATALEAEINNPPVPATAAEDSQRRAGLLTEQSEVEASIEQIKENRSEAATELREKIRFLDAQVQDLNAASALVEHNKSAQSRIDELKARERELAGEFERLEGELYLADQFIRTKVSLLENRINSRFQIARFKLFNVLINGGVEECCEVAVNGVSYNNLNNGMRIQSGCDIISTLQQHFRTSLPTWIDNKESITDRLKMPCQTIYLVVSSSDKQLRVEVADDREEVREIDSFGTSRIGQIPQVDLAV